MREHLYRGKALDNIHGWVVGSLLITDDAKNDPFRSTPLRKRYQIMTYIPGDWNMGQWGLVDVDPDTIGEFTGLTITNRQQIFEGDIVRYDDSPYNAYATPYTGEVVFYKGAWCVKIKHYGHWSYPRLFCDDFADRKTTLVGNVFDNPELIEKEDGE